MRKLFVTFATCLAAAALSAGCNDTRAVGACDVDSDCGDGSACVDGSCTPDRTYAYCAETSECLDARDQCIRLTVPAAATDGQYCTHVCASDDACESHFGFSAACYDVEVSGTFLCFQTCGIDADCDATSSCVQVDLGGGVIDFICLPNTL